MPKYIINTDTLSTFSGEVERKGNALEYACRKCEWSLEAIEHGVALLQLGCDLAQGYSIARPMPAKDITTWMGSWKPDKSWSI